jgi:hypothetical protein
MFDEGGSAFCAEVGLEENLLKFVKGLIVPRFPKKGLDPLRKE